MAEQPKGSLMTRLVPRKRTILGGVLAAGIAAGIYLGGKLPHLGSGIGLGQGGDSVIGIPAMEPTSGQSDVTGKPASEEPDHAEVDLGSEGAAPTRSNVAAPPDDVLTVLVDDRHYSIWKKSRRANGYFPAELSEIVKLAKQQSPNEDGIRVRILRSGNARYTAWAALQSDLVKSGIPADEIVVPKIEESP